MVLRNYFILRLAQLSWGLDTSSGEFSYSDLKHYWPQLSASPPKDPGSGAEAAGEKVCLHPSHCSSDPGGIVQAERPSFFRVDTSLWAAPPGMRVSWIPGQKSPGKMWRRRRVKPPQWKAPECTCQSPKAVCCGYFYHKEILTDIGKAVIAIGRSEGISSQVALFNVNHSLQASSPPRNLQFNQEKKSEYQQSLTFGSSYRNQPRGDTSGGTRRRFM